MISSRLRAFLQLGAIVAGAIVGAALGVAGAGVLVGVLVFLELERCPTELEELADEREVRELRSAIMAERLERGELEVRELGARTVWIGPRGAFDRTHKDSGGAGLAQHNCYYPRRSE